MARPLRIEIADGIHHVMSRGLVHRDVFRDGVDRRAFLLGLRDCIRRHELRCIAYCLMTSHFHLLTQTPRANLQEAMHDLLSDYARGFNARHGERGPLFAGRYKARLVQDNEYLLTVARYLALNPVRGGQVRAPEDWPWSSYADLHAGRPSPVADERPLLAVLSEDPETARRKFLDLVADGAGLPPYSSRKAILGDREFVRAHAPVDPPQRPVLRQSWDEARPPLSELVDRFERDEAMRQARITHRYTLEEIGAVLGCSASTVSRRLKRLSART